MSLKGTTHTTFDIRPFQGRRHGRGLIAGFHPTLLNTSLSGTPKNDA